MAFVERAQTILLLDHPFVSNFNLNKTSYYKKKKSFKSWRSSKKLELDLGSMNNKEFVVKINK